MLSPLFFENACSSQIQHKDSILKGFCGQIALLVAKVRATRPKLLRLHRSNYPQKRALICDWKNSIVCGHVIVFRSSLE